jgi:hypothetical protein
MEISLQETLFAVCNEVFHPEERQFLHEQQGVIISQKMTFFVPGTYFPLLRNGMTSVAIKKQQVSLHIYVSRSVLREVYAREVVPVFKCLDKMPISFYKM